MDGLIKIGRSMKLLQLFDGKVSLAISTIADGNMRSFGEAEFDEVLQNQRKLCAELGADARNTARVLTTYDRRASFCEYYEIDSKSITKHQITKPESELVLADGLVTKSADFALLLPLADCLGVIIYDETQGILGLLHSGRQNLEEDGAFKFIEFLQKNYNCQPENLRVYFSPHAQNFEIFALNHAKLAEAATNQLARAGVPVEIIERSDIDTVTNPDFPSNSAGDKTNRFAVAVKLC